MTAITGLFKKNKKSKTICSPPGHHRNGISAADEKLMAGGGFNPGGFGKPISSGGSISPWRIKDQ